MDISLLEPQQLPDGIRYYGMVKGAEAGELWLPEELPRMLERVRKFGQQHASTCLDPQQLAIRYRPGGGARDGLQLTVSWTPDPTAQLVGTDPARSVSIPMGDTAARYHDGQWAPGPSQDPSENVESPVGITHWDRTREHSASFHVADGVVGIRSARAVIGDSAELIAVLASIPYVSSLCGTP